MREPPTTDQELAASGQALAAFIVIVLDVLAAERPNIFLRQDTWQTGKRQLFSVARRKQGSEFRAVFARFTRRADYRHLPLAAEPLFQAVKNGVLSSEAAAIMVEAMVRPEGSRIIGIGD